MKSRLGKYIRPIFLFAVLCTFATIVLAYKNLQLLRDAESSVVLAQHIIARTQYIEKTLIHAESAQRGYILSGDEAYLPPIKKARKAIQEEIKNIDAMTLSPAIRNDLKVLEKLTDERIDLLEKGISLRGSQGLISAQQFIEEGNGKKKMDEALAVLEGIIAKENILLKERSKISEASYFTLFSTTSFTGMISLSMIILGFYVIVRELQKRTLLERNKDEFINMASHELKTPITSLKIFTQVMSKKLDLGQFVEARRYINKIDAQTYKLVSLITDLLDLSRIQTGKLRIEKEAFNLNALIDETVEETQGTTKIHEIVKKGDIARMVYADRYRIYQVLINLLTNAIKYSPEGGKITITVEQVRDDVVVSVEDKGIGIEEKFLEKVFERLYQVTDPREKTYPGLGVGLYISSVIVRRHGGKMWVQSKKDRGSTFYFSLPLRENEL